MASLRKDLSALPRDVWVIATGLFINKFGNFVNVFIVLYLTTKGYSAASAGAALAVIGLGNFFGNALGGMLADAFGRRRTIIISMFGSGIATLLVPAVSSFGLLVLLLGVLGIFAQLFRPAASAMTVDAVAPAQLLTAFALLRVAINVGMTAGPAVGGFLSGHSYTWIFIGDAATSIMFGFLAIGLLNERQTATPAVAEPTAETTGDSAGYGVVLRDRRYLAYLLAMVCATYVYIQATATLPLHVRNHGLSNETFGLLLGLNAVIVVFLELPITKFTGRFASRPVMAAGLVLLGIGMGLTGLTGAVLLIALTVIGWSVAEMIYTPVANAYPGEVAPKHAVGRYQGAEGLAHTLGATLGPALGGALFAVSPGLHWTVCLAVAVGGAGLIMLAKSPQRAEQPKAAPQEPLESLEPPALAEATGPSLRAEEGQPS